MSNERIIIAEDNCVMLDVMRYVLSGAGFEVLAAEDGSEALSLLEAHSADLLITDCQMPGISGLHLCRKIRENPRFHDLPVIFCSAKGFEIPRQTLHQLRVAEIICKPFSPSDLVRHVHRVLDSKQPLATARQCEAGQQLTELRAEEGYRDFPVTI